MASLNREQLIEHYYILRRAWVWVSRNKTKDAQVIAGKLKSVAVDIENVIGQIESQPAITWGSPLPDDRK